MEYIKKHKIVLICLTMIVGVQAFILWPYIDFIQVWDGYWYWHLCLQSALAEKFNPMGFNCSDHPNMGFFLPIALFVRLKILDPLLSILTFQWVLTFFSIPIFYGISRSLMKPSSTPLIPLITTLMWAMHPLLLANSLVTSPELGSAVYMLGALWAIIYHKVWLVPIFGTLFVFTKEPMIMIYGFFLLAVTISILPKISFSPSFFLAFYKIFQKIFIFLIPIFALLVYAFVRVHVYNLNLFHGANSNDAQLQVSAGTFLKLIPLSTRQAGILVMIFFNSFAWIPAIFVSLGFLKWCYLSYRRSSFIKVSPNAFKVILAFMISLYCLTRIIPYTNSRYLLPLVPLLLLLTPVAISYLNISLKFNIVILLAILGLFYQSQNKTLDPVSRWFFGTFDFGAHSLLSVTSYSGECCGGHGRDQLVYNLEFTKIFELQDLVYAAIKPTSKTVLVFPEDSIYFSTGPLDPISFKRTYRETSLNPQVIGHTAVEKSEAQEFYYISVPHNDAKEILTDFQKKYRLEETNQVAYQKYTLSYYKFSRI